MRQRQVRRVRFKDIESSASPQDDSALTDSIGMLSSSAMFDGNFIPIHLWSPDRRRRRKKKTTRSAAEVALEELHVKRKSRKGSEIGSAGQSNRLELYALQEEVGDSECSHLFNSFTDTGITQCMTWHRCVTRWIWDSARDHLHRRSWRVMPSLIWASARAPRQVKPILTWASAKCTLAI